MLAAAQNPGKIKTWFISEAIILDSQRSIQALSLVHRGKVRDVYAIDDHRLLMVASDRLSAFDVILPDAIPGKGEILTQLSNYWFEQTAGIVANHLTGVPLHDVLTAADAALLQRRAIVVKRLKPVPAEAIVRGYIIGSGWKDYQATGSLCNIKLPAGLRQAEQLPEPIFTPSSKAVVGDHDENISFAALVGMIGIELAEQIRTISLKLYQYAAAHASKCGIIIADTKFEFGLDVDNNLVLMDEIFTPDSSRFWPTSEYLPGTSPVSYDKQFVRDYLETLDWDKTSPGPNLPKGIINATVERYQSAYTALTGATWS